MEKTTENKVITRAEKKDATKNLIREVLAIKGYKHNELIDEVAALYIQRLGGEEADKINDVKGRVGSVLDVMKKESDVGENDGVYMLKARLPMPPPEVSEAEEKEKPAKKTRAKKTKTEPVPPAPLQPIAPVAPVSPETAPEPAEEKPAKRKRAKKTEEAETETEEKPKKKTTKRAVKKTESKDKDKEKKEEKKDEPTVIPENEPVIVPTPIPAPASEPTPPPQPFPEPAPAPIAAPAPVFDMTALFGEIKTPVKEQKPAEKKQEKPEPKPEKTEKEGGRVELKEKTEKKIEPKPAQKPAQKREEKQPAKERGNRAASSGRSKPLTAEESLKEAYLKKLRSLSGEYFEYYSVYLLEKYSRMNGRRLEGLRISGGDNDGGIDGEIELTDKLGFRETIYIQAKNWNPDKGKEHLWVVGETLLQQFLGACVCRQAKEGKQHCRGIFITTSRFTPEAKRLLDELSDRLVGYGENDLFEAAKECSFGLVQRNGNWVLDEKLLSGEKAFFNMF